MGNLPKIALGGNRYRAHLCNLRNLWIGDRPLGVCFELLEFSHTDFLIVNNDKAITPVGRWQICYKTIHGILSLFRGTRPSFLEIRVR